MIGTEKIEEVAEALKELSILAKKVTEDGKVDIKDLAHIVAFLPKISEVVESFKNLGELVEEGKDLDISEVIALIQKVHQKVKEVEKA